MGDYLSVIRRRKLLIAAMTLAGLALALFYSVAVAKPSYVSHAKVLVRPITADVTPQAPDKLIVMGTERETATSTDVATIAKDRMKSPAPVTTLQKKVTVSVVGTTQFLDIACSDKTKIGAQTCSQAFADAYLQYKTGGATKDRDARIANANAALNPINAQIVEATKRLAAAPVGSPAQAEAQSTLRSLQDQGAPYRQVLADMAKLNVSDAGAVVSPPTVPALRPAPSPRRTPSSAPSSASSSGCWWPSVVTGSTTGSGVGSTSRSTCGLRCSPPCPAPGATAAPLRRWSPCSTRTAPPPRPTGLCGPVCWSWPSARA